MSKAEKKASDERVVVMPEYLVEILKERTRKNVELVLNPEPDVKDVCIKIGEAIEVHLQNMYCLLFQSEDAIGISVTKDNKTKSNKIVIGDTTMDILLNKLADLIVPAKKKKGD